MRVVIADDNVDAATTLAVLLQIMDCQTAVAYDGETALHLVRSFKPSVVILDLDMPRCSGFRMVEVLKQEPDHAGRLYVALTGREYNEGGQRCKEAGFDDFYTKPISFASLSNLIDKAKRRPLAL